MPNPSGLPTVPPGYVDEDTGQTIAPVPVATWSDADRSAAIEAADAAMTAFARPALDQDTWWKELSPLLTPPGAHRLRLRASIRRPRQPGHGQRDDHR
ncbi:hypothetical protein JM654_04150 [Microbacterium oxydans]|nr:hypothetical protein [Microbacterium oxydans]